jgi:hypothetical protein
MEPVHLLCLNYRVRHANSVFYIDGIPYQLVAVEVPVFFQPNGIAFLRYKNRIVDVNRIPVKFIDIFFFHSLNRDINRRLCFATVNPETKKKNMDYGN